MAWFSKIPTSLLKQPCAQPYSPCYPFRTLLRWVVLLVERLDLRCAAKDMVIGRGDAGRHKKEQKKTNYFPTNITSTTIWRILGTSTVSTFDKVVSSVNIHNMIMCDERFSSLRSTDSCSRQHVKIDWGWRLFMEYIMFSGGHTQPTTTSVVDQVNCMV